MTSAPRHPTPPGTWRVGRLGSVDLLIKPSLLLMGVVLVAVFAPRFDSEATTNPYVLATVFVLALYGSVFLHELAHVGVARTFGMRVPSVTLHLLGGETLIEGESRSPWQELSTSIAGPLVSLALGLGALEISKSLDDGFGYDLAWSIAYVNIVVAIFNMLPGLPLDGGRVFKAVIWQVTGRELTGTRIAAWIGRLAAIGLVVFAIASPSVRDSGSVLSFVLIALIAWFLWQGSSDALHGADRMHRIHRLDAQTLAQPAEFAPPDAVPLPAHLSGADLLRAMADRPAERYALLDESNRVVGVLHARAVDEAYRAGHR